MKNCLQCQTLLPPDARFCIQCGAPQPAALAAEAGGSFDWQGQPIEAAYDRFMLRLRIRVESEQDSQRVTHYQERVYQSGFREIVQRRLEQWRDALPLEPNTKQQETGLRELRYLIDDLLDYFFVIHAADLNVVVLPQALLRYQQLAAEEVDLRDMALSTLDFEHEEASVYTDLLRLSEKKLKNVGRSFLFAERDEIIWFICDQSLLGSAKEGFAMTSHALYWKTGLQPPQRVYYHKLFSLRKEKEWMLINDLYFNASPSLNTKMMWLLRRLARLKKAEL